MTTAPPDARSATEALNRSARRIMRAERQGEWTQSVVDASLGFCGRAALFTIQGSRLRLELASFLPDGPVDAALEEAPAVAEAIASLSPVACAWSARELSPAIVTAFGSPGSGRAFLFPLTSGGRAVGFLLADGEVDASGLELVCTIAGAAWEVRRRRNEAAPTASNGLVTLDAQPAVAIEAGDQHRRAKRFASVRIAELSLYQAAKVTDGRAASDLYDRFREEIDRERQVFLQRRQPYWRPIGHQ